MARYEQAEEASRGLELWILRLPVHAQNEALAENDDFVDGSLGLAKVVFAEWKHRAKTRRLLEKERVFVITNRVTSVKYDEPSPPSPSRERDLHDLPPSCKAK